MTDRLETLVDKAISETVSFNEEVAECYEAVMTVVGPIVEAADELADAIERMQPLYGTSWTDTRDALAAYLRIREGEPK